MSPKDVFARPRELIYGPRQRAYNHPLENFAITGRLWGALLEHWRDSDEDDVPPELVALMLSAVKMAREVYLHADDNLDDAIGYLGNAKMIYERYDQGG